MAHQFLSGSADNTAGDGFLVRSFSHVGLVCATVAWLTAFGKAVVQVLARAGASSSPDVAVHIVEELDTPLLYELLLSGSHSWNKQVPWHLCWRNSHGRGLGGHSSNLKGP